jgi:hypothetical protein
LYEFYDNTDKKYILDSITKINENKLEETKWKKKKKNSKNKH